MKYIILETTEGMRFSVIFPEILVHADVALFMTELTDATIKRKAVPVSAGHIALGTDFTCSGGSDTLNMQSRPQDEAIVGIGEQAWAFPDAMLISLWAKAKLHKEGKGDEEAG
jgi:hypothetical protein